MQIKITLYDQEENSTEILEIDQFDDDIVMLTIREDEQEEDYQSISLNVNDLKKALSKICG